MLIPEGKSWHHLHDVLFVSDTNGKVWLYCVWMFRKSGLTGSECGLENNGRRRLPE